MTKTAAGEYNAIAPGASRRRVTALPPEGQDLLMAPQPLHRFGTPEEVAEAVPCLSSDMSLFVLGTVLSIDGGATSNAQLYDPTLSPAS